MQQGFRFYAENCVNVWTITMSHIKPIAASTCYKRMKVNKTWPDYKASEKDLNMNQNYVFGT